MKLTKTSTRPHCRHCGGNIFYQDEDGKSHCALCSRPYHDFRDYGRMGGLQTVLSHPPGYMSELGKRGGRPRSKTLDEIRQQQASAVQSQLKGGRLPNLPNSLKELKKLYKLQQRSKPENNGNGEASL